MVITALSVSTKMMGAPVPVVDIGAVKEVSGTTKLIRDNEYDLFENFQIQSYDDVRTANGRVAINFIDESEVRLTEHSSLVIDEYIYDPNPTKTKMALKFASGTARFISGNLAKIDKRNISLKTPTAQIAVRGTDFTCTVDELGKSLIILLPDENGDASGEIVVSTLAGQVVLNKPYESTVTSLYETPPSNPVILNLDLAFIDNYLIINPPNEERLDIGQDSQNGSADYLEFAELDFDFLAEDFLDNEQELEFTELDIDYLDQNFLEDLLNVIDSLAVDETDELSQVASSVNIQGTFVGQDGDTQITTILQDAKASFRRNISNSLQIDIDDDSSTTIIMEQDGVSNLIKLNGGTDSTISINQT
tara:strand:- start:61 stop:1149 length:1089 start_codon:yes stop_codon:yes gene_type:complete